MDTPDMPCSACGTPAAVIEVAMRKLSQPEQGRIRRYCQRCWSLLRRELQRAEDAASQGRWED